MGIDNNGASSKASRMSLHARYWLVLWILLLVWLVGPRVYEYYLIQSIDSAVTAGRREDELQYWKRLVRLYPKEEYKSQYAESLLAEARSLTTAGETDEALRMVDRSLSVSDPSADFFRRCSVIALENGDEEGAEYLVSRAAAWEE